MDLVPSGTTSVPAFPGTLKLETGLQGNEKGEYHLVGLGIRTVSFLNIQVYVLGFYVHGEDFEALQKEVLKVLGEKSPVTEEEKLRVRKRLLDTKEGEEVWEKVLSEGRWRSVVRIVPTRNTGMFFLFFGFRFSSFLEDLFFPGGNLSSKFHFRGYKIHQSITPHKACTNLPPL